MVNDLKPNPAKKTPEEPHKLLVPHISLSRTHELVDLCISRYTELFPGGESAGSTHPRLEEAMPYRYGSPTSLSISTHVRRQSPPPSPSRPPPVPPDTSSSDPKGSTASNSDRSRSNSSRDVFRSLEHYITASFDGVECLNASFSTAKPPLSIRAKSESSTLPTLQSPERRQAKDLDAALSPVDAKTILLGDFAENGMWWTGKITTHRFSRVVLPFSETVLRVL